MRGKRTGGSRAALLGLALGGWAVAMHADPVPVLTFEADAVVASGFTPSAQVAWLAVLRTDTRYQSAVSTRREVVTDTDGDGSVRLVVAGGVPWKSAWIAVDLTTGMSATAAPQDFPASVVDLPPGSVLRDGAGALDELHLATRWAEWMVVRPGLGAWGASVVDGGEGDSDGDLPDELTTPLSRLASVSGALAVPGALAGGDLVLVIQPESFEVSVYAVLGVEP